MIPRVIVRVGHLGPDQLHDARASFEQPARQQAALAKRIPAIAIPHFHCLTIQCKGITRTTRGNEIQRTTIILVQTQVLHRCFDRRHLIIEHVTQLGPALQSQAEQIRTELKVINLDAVHLAHVEIIPIREQRVRIVGLAQETGTAALAHHIRFLKRPRELHKGKHWLIRRLQANDVAAEVREIFGIRRLQLTGGAHLIRRVARHDLVDRSRVIEEPIRRIAHRIDHRELVIHLRQLRQDFREMMPRHLGRNRFESTAHLVRHILFRVPEIQMARTALEIDHQHMLGLSPARTPCGCRTRRGRLSTEHVIQRQPHHPSPTDAQDITATETQVGITQIFSELARNTKHRMSRLS